MDIVGEIKECIEQQLDKEKNKFIIFPFGDVGRLIKHILQDAYAIEPKYILDNHFSKYNSNIKELSFLSDINCEEFVLILANTNPNIYINLKLNVLEYIKDENIAELRSMKHISSKEENYVRVGKYSYGPLCNHWLVESVGAFCSFAPGSEVVPNHAMQYLSTHPFLYLGAENNMVYDRPYDVYKNMKWYFEGVIPKGNVEKLKKIRIGNDVWLGKNVIITNGANIGNGVIAGAGSIITKDVPDYTVVVGAPAKIIRFRYTPNQIAALNKIQWWNWSDDKIRERYDDFYLPIDEFIAKHNF